MLNHHDHHAIRIAGWTTIAAAVTALIAGMTLAITAHNHNPDPNRCRAVMVEQYRAAIIAQSSGLPAPAATTPAPCIGLPPAVLESLAGQVMTSGTPADIDPSADPS